MLLAQSEAGYKNLMVLVSKAHLESDRNEAPQIALQDLEGYTGDVICLTGVVSGPVGQYLQKGQLEQAETCLNYLQSIFAGRLYMELMRHNDSLEDKLEPVFLDFAYKYDIPIVATNQVFFPARKMYEAHDALLYIAGGN